MMENLLTSTSPVIDTPPANSQTDRSSPITVTEFDGETVLCRVCGDRASGFHYGVHACEGCKGFFRRSIQQKIQYRPCLKNQQCNIQRVNRNRCQYCRLKKCISVGMSRDAVRFGRVPKKEKARIIEQMQKKSALSQAGELSSLLSNGLDVVHAVVSSHMHTCDLTQMRAAQMREHALTTQQYVSCPSNMACPLNNELGMDTNANRSGVGVGGGSGTLTDFSESFTPAIKSVVDFAKGIPGFVLLNQDDQVTLLKAGTFEVLLVRFACLFDPQTNTMMFTGGKLYQRQASTTVTTNAGFLLDSMFDFAERFNKMYLRDEEIALFSAVVLMSPDRPGLRNVEQVERIQSKLSDALQNKTNANHREDPTLFTKLIMKRQDLRTLNTLHSEKSIARQRANSERRERQNTDDCDMDFQDSLSTRSGRSSPSLSEGSNMTMTSGYSGETGDSGSAVVGQRLPLEASTHQQVVLRTPYGTFFREEMSGFYGMMPDQPRRRCNTLDRDTLTRPRLHTIEEGNRRRYTLDRDYINKMVNRLSDRLEPRESGIAPPTCPISTSATSSPIQEEGSSATMRGAAGSTSSGYSSSGSVGGGGGGGGFTPISLPEGAQGGGGAGGLQLPVSRTSPMAAGSGVNVRSTPGSPNSRSRSGSLSQQAADDYLHMRPRCFSFHHTSEGRAGRMSLQRRLLAAAAAANGNGPAGSGSGGGQGVAEEEMVGSSGHPQGGKQQASPLSSIASVVTSGDSPYLSAEMRRGSVGTAYGLHNRKSSLLVDRPLSYITRGAGGANAGVTGVGGTEMDNRAAATASAVAAAHGLPLMKHVMPDGSLYGLGLAPPPDLSGHAPHSHPASHPALWHPQAAAAAAIAMGLAPPPPPPPHAGHHMGHPMMQQRSPIGTGDGISRSASFSASSSSASSYPSPGGGVDWDALAKQQQRAVRGASSESEQQMKDLNQPPQGPSTSKAGSPSTAPPMSGRSPSADAAAMKAAAVAAQGNMMMNMMMMGRPIVDVRNDPLIGHAFAAAAKERIGGRRSAGGMESKGEGAEHSSRSQTGFSSPPCTSSASLSLPPPQAKTAASPTLGNDSQGQDQPSSSSNGSRSMTLSPTESLRPKAMASPDAGNFSSAKVSPERNSPIGEEGSATESFGHKKFDKFRKVQAASDNQQQATGVVSPTSSPPATAQGSSESKDDPSSDASMVKEEKMEQDEEDERDDEDEEDEEERSLKVDLSGVKVERKSPQQGVQENNEEDEDARMTPNSNPEAHSLSPAHSPSGGAGGEKPKLSAKEAHPNLLAHLMNGGRAIKNTPSAGQATVGVAAKYAVGSNSGQVGTPGMGLPWTLSGQGIPPGTMRHPFGQIHPHQHFQHEQQQQQQQMFKHPAFGGRQVQPLSSALPTAGPASTLPSALFPGCHAQQGLFSNTPVSLDNASSSSRRSSTSPSSQQQSQDMDSSSSINSNTKDETHATAVSNLKDKILRKYDSMENLQKIPKGDLTASPSSSSSSSSSSQQPQLTSSQSSSALLTLASSSRESPPSAAPITARSNSTGNTTEGLNKELATKLTIHSNTGGATADNSRSCSPLDSTPTLTPTPRPNSSPSSSSRQFSSPPAIMDQASPSAGPVSVSLPGAPSSNSDSHHAQPMGHFLSPSVPPQPHPASALAQIPQMLLSQGVHPASLPMYHSMLARQFPPPPASSTHSTSSTTSSSSPSSSAFHGRLPSNTDQQSAPLASMQRFADLFARGQNAEPGEKRSDHSLPLNLTSRMDEGQRLSSSSSPSKSPQTPA